MNFTTGYIRTRLSAMMFLQFFVWATWWVPVVTYAMLGRPFLDASEAGLLAGTVALGAIFAPLLVGPIADRWFATEHVLCVLHVAGGIFLLLASRQEHFWPLFTCLLMHTLCFMPTLALANSLSFRNLADANQFPRIALFGTIGFVVSGWLVGFGLGETSPAIFYVAACAEILLAAYCLTLPHTPPKGEARTVADMLGLKAVMLLREPAFLLFVACAFLITIPASFYFIGCNTMLKETGRFAPTAIQTLSQISEMAVMFAMPWLIGAVGLRAILGLGMVAWALRYLLFATLSFPFIVLGLLLHGFAYCFVYVGAYIYVDKKAPQDLKASAQSFIAFLMLGVGGFLGATLGGSVIQSYPAFIDGMPATQQIVLEKDGAAEEIESIKPIERAPLPQWTTLGDRLDQDGNGEIWLGELQRIPPVGFQLIDETPAGGGAIKKRITTYSKDDLARVLTKVDDRKPIRTRGDFKTAKIGEISVTRADWMTAQVHRWPPMWVWFAFVAGAIASVYAIGTLFTFDETTTTTPRETPVVPPTPPVEPPAAAQAAEPMMTPPAPESEPPTMRPPASEPPPPV